MSRRQPPPSARAFLHSLAPGALVSTTVIGFDGHDVVVDLDGDAGHHALGRIPRHELSWHHVPDPAAFAPAGHRLTAEIRGIDHDKGLVRLSSKICEDPELRSYLGQVRPGRRVSGTITSIHPFGVFVRLDGEPPHPVHPAVGFIRIPYLSWTHFDRPEDVVRPGQRVRVEIVVADDHNGEVVVSLRDTQEDPMLRFADRVGETVTGRITNVVPFGVFVQVTNDGIIGLLHKDDLTADAAEAPDVTVGDMMTVRVDEVDLPRRRVALSLVRHHA
ncbi:S1 RNA-binding domain-containing protein [Streptomyces sp. SID8379]|uniref:S1 RNA-binding domain-containing protein n=1 Tax=unclassified Streptomyces TaxID=2593676 RepID=UPI00036874CC|nr:MULTISPECIES: S1 RNA-binding domain-containing protein [unclassified Streptomyces]MYW64987.1 S1 RNA-binding domain-containing protein [Streptomyces sp. SID8379]